MEIEWINAEREPVTFGELKPGEWFVVARHNPLIRVAARLVRGELLPKSGRIAQAEVRRLEESHKLTGIRVKDESDKLRTLIAEQAAEIARLRRDVADAHDWALKWEHTAIKHKAELTERDAEIARLRKLLRLLKTEAAGVGDGREGLHFAEVAFDTITPQDCGETP